MSMDPTVRKAEPDDARVAARLMYEFDREFEMQVDEQAALERRYREQLANGDVIVLFVGEEPDGFAQLRYRTQLHSDALDAYLQELYVVPHKRGQGLGRALLEAAMKEAVEQGADHIDLGTSEDDTAARGLYESMGFTNREGRPDGPVMLYYERDL